MLYVSRYLGNDNYGVVDSDDGVETIVTAEEILHYIKDLNLEIAGVVPVRKGRWKKIIGILDIRPYAFKRSGLQLKTQMLLGVDVGVYDDEITEVNINNEVAQEMVRVRVSDFAHRMYWGTPVRWSKWGQSHIVFVLDDSVTMWGEYPRLNNWAIHWDISEVTNVHLMHEVYLELAAYHYDRCAYDDCVINTPERDAFWRFWFDLKQKTNRFRVIDDVVKLLPDRDTLGVAIYEEFKGEFHNLPDNIDKNRTKEALLGRARALFSTVQPSLETYDTLLENSDIIFGILNSKKRKKYASLYRFEKYIKLFETTEDVKLIYVRLCWKVYSVIMEV